MKLPELYMLFPCSLTLRKTVWKVQLLCFSKELNIAAVKSSVWQNLISITIAFPILLFQLIRKFISH